MQKFKKKLIVMGSVGIVIAGSLGYNLLNKPDDFQVDQNKKEMIAMYIQDEEGNYQTSASKEFPRDGYFLNLEKSTCKNGGILSQDPTTKVISLKVSHADACNLYFDKELEIAGEMIARQSGTSTEKIWGDKDNIVKIVLENKLNPKSGATKIYDMSVAQNGSIMSYLVPTETDSTKYNAYIQANGKIAANTNMGYFFYRFTALERIEGISNLDTSNVTNMTAMFGRCYNLTSLDLSSFDTSNVTKMDGMFTNDRNLESLNLKNINTSKVTDMSWMFSANKSLVTLDLSSFDTSNVTNMRGMFFMYDESDTADTYITSKLTEIVGLENFNTSNVTDMSSMFVGAKSLTSLNLSSFDTSNVTSMEQMFLMSVPFDNTVSKMVEIKGLENFNTSKVTSMSGMFNALKNLTVLNVSSFDTSNVTDMSHMFDMYDQHNDFDYISKLTKIIGLESFNTNKVTNMHGMFQHLKNVSTLDISHFNTSKVTDMAYMFSRCTSLTNLNISNFNVSSVTEKDYILQLVPSSIMIKVSNTNMRDWVINASFNPKLTTSNFTIT